ncbi:MAG: isoprenylcysteine carboxyl methyltransferase family protein [Desulfocapsaceae bacterium]
MIVLAILLTILIAQRLSELALAKRNYRWAMRHGGREYGAENYWLFIALHSLWLVSMILECLVLQPSPATWWPLFLGLIVVAQILRYWAIVTLGRCWNTRIVIFEQMSPVKSGPYRYLKHPNYLAVALEILAFPALLGAWYTALIFSIANGALLLLIRIPQEERALQIYISEGKSPPSGTTLTREQ